MITVEAHAAHCWMWQTTNMAPITATKVSCAVDGCARRTADHDLLVDHLYPNLAAMRYCAGFVQFIPKPGIIYALDCTADSSPTSQHELDRTYISRSRSRCRHRLSVRGVHNGWLAKRPGVAIYHWYVYICALAVTTGIIFGWRLGNSIHFSPRPAI